MLHPDLYKVTEGEKVTYQKALQTVLAVHPKGEIQRVYTPDEPSAQGVYLFNLKEKERQNKKFTLIQEMVASMES